MGVRNFLVEGASGTGKTSVCRELQRRGQHAVNGDRELAYRGDPETGRPVDDDDGPWSPELVHGHHLWSVAKVTSLVADRDRPATFFCGGSRNVSTFVDLFDAVFVLRIDAETLQRRLDARPADEFGGRPAERELILRLHATGEDTPGAAIPIDATAPLPDVVDEILRLCDLARGETQPPGPT